MKLALVYDRQGRPNKLLGPLLIFKFFLYIRNETGWSLHILVFLNGVKQDFSSQSFAGVFSIGREYGDLFVGFTPNSITHRLILKRNWRII